jgi:hypothetical protein
MTEQKKPSRQCQLDTREVEANHEEVIMSGQDGKSPFIPAWLDDANLTPAQFRVLCHIFRRGDSFSNAATIAKTCRLKRDTVFEALSILETAGFIKRTSRPGQTTLVEPVPFGGMGSANPSRLGGREVSRSGGRDPSRLGGHKGTPIKELPSRKGTNDLFPMTETLPFPSKEFRSAWESWEQHRREIKKKLTPESIRQQFRKLVEMGESRSIAAINHSIANGWQGIFEPKPDQGTANGNRTAHAPEGAVVSGGRIYKP